MILFGKRVADIADVGRDIGDGDGLATRFRFDLLEVQHGGQGVASLPDQRTTARHLPAGGVARVGSAMAFFRFHEENPVFCLAQDFGTLGDGRRIDPVLGIHEQSAAGRHSSFRFGHLLHDAFIHQGFRQFSPDR